jgi:hypothetical protein
MLPPWPTDFAWNFRSAQLACAQRANVGVPLSPRGSDSRSSGHLLIAAARVLSGDLAGAQTELAALAAEAPAGPEGGGLSSVANQYEFTAASGAA